MKDAQSNYAYNTGTLGLMVAMRKEAKLQGVNLNDIIWDCSTVCYDKNFLQQGGGDVDGVNMTLAFLPFEETKTNKALASYVKGVGADNVATFGAYTWVAGLLFRDSVNTIVKRDGVNGVTRAALLEQLKNTHAFDGDGMWGTTDVGGQRAESVLHDHPREERQVHERVYPKKPGTLDCKKSNNIEYSSDLLGS